MMPKSTVLVRQRAHVEEKLTNGGSSTCQIESRAFTADLCCCEEYGGGQYLRASELRMYCEDRHGQNAALGQMQRIYRMAHAAQTIGQVERLTEKTELDRAAIVAGAGDRVRCTVVIED